LYNSKKGRGTGDASTTLSTPLRVTLLSVITPAPGTFFKTAINNNLNMKTNFRILLIAALLVTAPLLMLAQSPPHPNNGNAPTHGTNGPVGGGAPVGSGVVLLAALAVAYGTCKLYQLRSIASIKE